MTPVPDQRGGGGHEGHVPPEGAVNVLKKKPQLFMPCTAERNGGGGWGGGGLDRALTRACT